MPEPARIILREHGQANTAQPTIPGFLARKHAPKTTEKYDVHFHFGNGECGCHTTQVIWDMAGYFNKDYVNDGKMELYAHFIDKRGDDGQPRITATTKAPLLDSRPGLLTPVLLTPGLLTPVLLTPGLLTPSPVQDNSAATSSHQTSVDVPSPHVQPPKKRRRTTSEDDEDETHDQDQDQDPDVRRKLRANTRKDYRLPMVDEEEVVRRGDTEVLVPGRNEEFALGFSPPKKRKASGSKRVLWASDLPTSTPKTPRNDPVAGLQTNIEKSCPSVSQTHRPGVSSRHVNSKEFSTASSPPKFISPKKAVDIVIKNTVVFTCGPLPDGVTRQQQQLDHRNFCTANAAPGQYAYRKNWDQLSKCYIEKIAHARLIHGVYGVPAPEPCDRCAQKGLDCRVYHPALKLSTEPGLNCAR
ncbi:hypothetical protein M011DRAFT_457404 [Sporormia fimetaria CBS 119925]|uniref:Uncharacterized protein n=1 Tax=Sporormia fimetaria CBS 119925 TaxID=1340428 RepID=A0A6A6VFU4_9PLEO|nr:hypothetical protein M011DRAFT_457404 [Sporormia fimetaria CBS 119925]